MYGQKAKRWAFDAQRVLEGLDNLLMRTRQTKVERWNGSSVYSSETYTYNWLDGVATKTTATANTYTYTYDSLGRLTKLNNPGTTYQTTSYDDVNNMKTVTDENGHQKKFGYDWNSRLASVKEFNSSTNYFLTSYSYDQVGNLLSLTDAKNQATSYQYDDLNRLTKTTYPDTKSETKTYDNVGNLLTRTDPKTNQTSYTYDSLNRLTKVTYPNTSTDTYTYDASSNRLSMVDPASTSYYTYDARNRLTNESKIIAGTRYSTLYTYDPANNVAATKYPDSYLLSLTYDAVNRVKKVGSFATVSYSVDDKMSTITFGNGEVATYSYDNRDRPTRILVKMGSTKNLDLNYTYDGTGNVLTLNTESYGYDWLDRLTSSSGPWTAVTYTYDQVGNRIKMVQGSTTTYSYGSFNRLSSAGSTTYTYDANGNMITKNDGMSWAFTYDYDNRLTKVVHAGTTVLQSVYDGDGKRIKKTEGDPIVFTYQGLNVLYEKDLTTGVVTKRFYANGLQVANMVGSTVSYLHEDHIGSIRFISSATGSGTFSSNYVPYGPQYGASGSPDEFLYAGKIYDGSTGFYYFGARFYDPTTGRFVTQDSSSGVQEDPQSFNRYAYARDNPLKIIDPNGHDWNIFGALTSTFSAVSSAVSTAAGTVTSTVSGVVSAVSNAWNSLPPQEKGAVITTLAVVAVVATAGLATPVVAPIAIGAIAGATSSLGVGLYKGDASAVGVLTSATIGAVSGGFGAAAGGISSAVGQLAANTVIGAGTTFVNQQLTSFTTTGKWAPTTPSSVFGAVLGGVFGAGGSALGTYLGRWEGLSWAPNAVRTTIVTSSATTIGTSGVQVATPIPMIVGPPRWIR